MTKRPRRRGLRAVLVGACAALAGLALPAAAQAALDVTSFTTSLSSTTAGAHADYTAAWMFDAGPGGPSEQWRSLELAMPAGLIGNARTTPTCSPAAFADPNQACPADSQVGEIMLNVVPGFDIPGWIYNLDANPSQPARLGIRIDFGGSFLPVGVVNVAVRNGGDYGLTSTMTGVARQIPISGLSMTLFGVPADHGVATDRRPFMVNGTECDSALTSTIVVDSYQDPDTKETASHTMPSFTECGTLPFEPRLAVQPERAIVDKPSALNVDIVVPQSDDPDGRSSSALRNAGVRLPEGVSINPSLAHDRTACSDDAFGRNSGAPTACPAGSKIGSVGLDVPALRQPLPGDIYLGEPKAGNPFRLFVVAEGIGVRVKLEGSVQPDPNTGQMLTTFDGNPPVPFSRFHLRFAGGDRAALLMPTTCGSKQATASFTPWSGNPPAGATAAFNVFADNESGACPEQQPFAPTFSAGVTNAKSGADTGFSMSIGRPDGHQMLKSLKLEMPTGLLGRLANFPLCPNDRANAGTCSEDSLVGGVIVSAGSGDGPLNVAGRVFITEPPKPGQIAGLSIVVPAVAGPYNLGTPVVRAGITVNPDTSLTVESDPFPEILSGIPLRIKQLIVTLDRGGFMLNPTDCSPKTIEATLVSTGGAESKVASPFALNGCPGLPFAPIMSIATDAPVTGHATGITVGIDVPAGSSAMRVVNVVLPSSLGANLEGPLQTPCTPADFAADKCADSARVGEASANTPVLPSELRGPIYFIENLEGNGLPKLGVRLKGAVQIDVIGDVTINPSGRIVTSFPAIPDVPISHFELKLQGGEQGVLTAGAVCSGKQSAYVQMIGHTGKEHAGQVPVTVNGCKAKSASKKSKSAKKAKRKDKKR